MIAVDSSAFVAILALEPEAERFSRRLAEADARAMSAGNYLECAMIAESRFGGRAVLDNWLRERAIEIVSVDLPMAQGAAEAFRRFGKRTHQAALNHGDCFAYALAKSLDAPLLFKGCDFALTDIQSALP
jgi:ribonuclease VapC